MMTNVEVTDSMRIHEFDTSDHCLLETEVNLQVEIKREKQKEIFTPNVSHIYHPAANKPVKRTSTIDIDMEEEEHICAEPDPIIR